MGVGAGASACAPLTSERGEEVLQHLAGGLRSSHCAGSQYTSFAFEVGWEPVPNLDGSEWSDFIGRRQRMLRGCAACMYVCTAPTTGDAARIPNPVFVSENVTFREQTHVRQR